MLALFVFDSVSYWKTHKTFMNVLNLQNPNEIMKHLLKFKETNCNTNSSDYFVWIARS
jgi:hypothetical protein